MLMKSIKGASKWLYLSTHSTQPELCYDTTFSIDNFKFHQTSLDDLNLSIQLHL